MQSLKYHPDRAGASCTAAFQRVAQAFAVLNDGDKRAAYDQGGDVKTSRKGGGDDDDEDEEEDEEHKQSLREEIERKFYPGEYLCVIFAAAVRRGPSDCSPPPLQQSATSIGRLGRRISTSASSRRRRPSNRDAASGSTRTARWLGRGGVH